MDSLKRFAISFIISLVIFGLIAFIIVQFMWPANDSANTPDLPVSVQTDDLIM